MIDKFFMTIPVKAVPGSNRKIVVNGRIIDVAKGKAGFVAQTRLYAAARAEKFGWQPVAGPVSASYRFFFKRPASHYGTGRNADTLKKSAPDMHTQRPDLVNLIKCMEDALTGIIWRDDSQVREIDAVKFWAESDSISIEVERIETE